MFEKIKRHKIFLKALVASLLLWYVFKDIDFSAFLLILKKANFFLLAFAFILIIISQMFISNFKWLIILREYKITVPFKTLCDMYLVGMFFSIFLPGSYGGDLIRARQISRYTDRTVEGVMSIVLERVTGLIGLLAVLLLSLLFVDQSVIPQRVKLWGIGLIIILFCGGVLLMSRGLVRKFSFLVSLAGERFEAKAKEVYETIYKLKDKKIAVQIISLSILFQFMTIVVNYIIAMSLNITVPFTYMMFAVPIISFLTIMPVSLSGIGVRDISYIGLLGAIGVDKESAFSIGLVAFLMIVTVSLYGGIVFIRQKSIL